MYRVVDGCRSLGGAGPDMPAAADGVDAAAPAKGVVRKRALTRLQQLLTSMPNRGRPVRRSRCRAPDKAGQKRKKGEGKSATRNVRRKATTIAAVNAEVSMIAVATAVNETPVVALPAPADAGDPGEERTLFQVHVPPGAKEGDVLRIQVQKQPMEITVPAEAKAGDLMYINVPAEAPGANGAPASADKGEAEVQAEQAQPQPQHRSETDVRSELLSLRQTGPAAPSRVCGRARVGRCAGRRGGWATAADGRGRAVPARAVPPPATP